MVKRLVDAGEGSQRGLVYQALASAITDVQLTEYYKFLAMMQVWHAYDLRKGILGWSRNTMSASSAHAVSYTHLTLPTTPYV